MKKTVAILLTAILAVSLLTACGSGDSNNTQTNSGSSSSSAGGGSWTAYDNGAEYEYPQKEMSIQPSAAPMPPGESYDMGYGSSRGDQYESGSGLPNTADAPSDIDTGAMAEKIIYTAYASVETVDFDETIESVYTLMRMNNAFIENSYIGGRNYSQSYYGFQTYRTANFTLRVPKERFEAIKADLEVLGNVTSLNTDAKNITAQFIDNESRLTSYRIQEERLLAMLEKADTVTDMISIESRLSDIRYNIESLTSTLKNWQSQVDYSTMTISIYEVEKFTETVPIQRTYWQQVGDGLKARTKGVGEFFTNLLKWVIVNLPVLAILAIIVIAVVIIVRKRMRKQKEHKDE